jgi:hypothetical protein
MSAAVAPEPRLRRVPVPIREPRAAVSVRPTGRDEPPPTQGTLALALPWEAPPARRGPIPAPPVADRPREGTRRPGGALPEPRDWAATFALAAMEVAAGLRPSGQLIRWTSPEVHEALTLRGALNARRRQARAGRPPIDDRPVPAGRKVSLRALVTGTPADGVCEVAAVLRGPDRIRAVAFRMEGYGGRWRVTALQIG